MDPIMQTKDMICKYDPEYGGNKRGWANFEWMEVPYCHDKGIYCDDCIRQKVEKINCQSPSPTLKEMQK